MIASASTVRPCSTRSGRTACSTNTSSTTQCTRPCEATSRGEGILDAIERGALGWPSGKPAPELTSPSVRRTSDCEPRNGEASQRQGSFLNMRLVRAIRSAASGQAQGMGRSHQAPRRRRIAGVHRPAECRPSARPSAWCAVRLRWPNSSCRGGLSALRPIDASPPSGTSPDHAMLSTPSVRS